MEEVGCRELVQQTIPRGGNAGHKRGLDGIHSGKRHMEETSVTRAPPWCCQTEHGGQMSAVQSIVEYVMKE